MKQLKFLFLVLGTIITQQLFAQKEQIKDSNVYWELNNGVLTISGSGAIPDYCGAPWRNKGIVEKVVIEDGVTSIGTVNFWEYSSPNHLKTVEIGNTVTTIGENAFEYCRLLQSVKIGSSVKSIGMEAFADCSSLRYVVIPSSVRTIGNGAFARCSNLQSIVIDGAAPFNEDRFRGYNCPKLFISRMLTAPNNAEYALITDANSDINHNRCGLKDSNGNWTIEMGKYKKIAPLIDNFLRVQDGVKYGIVTYDGKEIVPPELDAIGQCGKGYLRYKLNGFWGVMNYSGKIIIDTNRGYTSIGDYVSFTKRFPYTMAGYKGECDATGRQISKIKVETPKQNTAVTSSTGSSSNSSSSSSSSSNSNSGNNTTTIHVEHHHDPVPVQQWQACIGCGGMGTMGCDFCGGSGTKYIGDRLHRCSRCNGRGIIPCNVCYGNKGKYITVYQ